MALEASRVDIWAGSIKDKPGGLAAALSPLADAGTKLEYVMARREKKGKGVLFVTPIKGAKQAGAARRAGLHKTKSLFAVRAEGRDKTGLGATITCALADAGINLRGLSAAVIGGRFIMYLALDTAKDTDSAISVIQDAF